MTKPRFFNRDLSWVEFNKRVLSEARSGQLPLLERLRFLGIVSSNFDEFFMVRVATLKRQLRQGKPGNSPCGRSPAQQLEEIAREVRQTVNQQQDCLLEMVLPALAKAGIRIIPRQSFSPEQRDAMQAKFERDILPVLSPIRIEPKRELPFTGNLRLYIAFTLQEIGKDHQDRLVIVELPGAFQRFFPLPAGNGKDDYALLEDIILDNARQLFPGYTIIDQTIFRVTRDADLGVDEERDEDFVEAMEEILVGREHSRAVRLQIHGSSKALEEKLRILFQLDPSEVYHVPGPLAITDFNEIVSHDGYAEHTFSPWRSSWPAGLEEETDIFELLQREDLLLHHPYDSFEPVVKLLTDAANDNDVLAIKMTLYRTSGNSRIVQALERAAANGKQVTVLVELKARFDEEQNISWANRLERAGAIVIYGIAELKVHSKAALIIRRERDGIRRYIHLGTGNYHEKTAKLYTDMGLMTSREDLSYDVAMFFNSLTGYSAVHHLQKLIMAPISLKEKVIKMIDREAERSSYHTQGLIRAKMNSLADPDVIEALYRASIAGVHIELNVRGICMLVPGVKGLSDHIRVVSIVGRYLEHSRIFHFHNGGDDEYYLSSADWMPRNLERRAELMFPVESEPLRQRLDTSLAIFFSDTLQAHQLQPDGSYTRLQPAKKKTGLSAQQTFHEKSEERRQARQRISPKKAFTVRRKPPKTG